MNKSKYILSGVLGAAFLSGGVAYGQNILMLATDGHDGEPLARDFGAWIETERPGYTVDISADVDNSLTTATGTSISSGQMATLNSYDLIISPRGGTGGSGNFGSTDWNNVSTGILNMNPFSYGDDRWQWIPAGTTTSAKAMGQMIVQDSTSPLFDGVDTSGGSVDMYQGTQENMSVEWPAGDFTGNVVSLTDADPAVEGQDEPWVIMWDGSESAFYVVDGTPGDQAPGGRRTMFLGTNTGNTIAGVPSDVYTADGQTVLLNAIDSTIPEPGTYALFAGFGALGGVLLLRRWRLAKSS